MLFASKRFSQCSVLFRAKHCKKLYNLIGGYHNLAGFCTRRDTRRSYARSYGTSYGTLPVSLPVNSQARRVLGSLSIYSNRYYFKLGSKVAMVSKEGSKDIPKGNVEVSRIMLPDDANVVGNVHGGTILAMIEQAGFIVATRHCNNPAVSTKPLLGVLARVEHTDFLQPMYIGELSKLQARVTFTSLHSIEVTADVWAENLTTGNVRKTNQAVLWYVAIEVPDKSVHYCKNLVPMEVPQCTSLTDEEFKKGQERYQYQKQDRASFKGNDTMLLKVCDSSVAEVGTADHSQSTLVHLVLPSDCVGSGQMRGGVLMKLMDECAGIVAARHCRTNVVTISLDAVNFTSPVLNGELVTLRGRLTFTSERSMEVAVTVQAEGMAIGSRRSTNTAYFTFVSLPKGSHHAQKVPLLKVVTDQDKKMFEDGKNRYLARKQMRNRL